MKTTFPNIKHLIFFILLSLVIVSCDKKASETEPQLDWKSLTGNYTGEFAYKMRSDSTHYWFIVNRIASFEQINPDKFNLSFQDTLYNFVAYYQTNRYPFMDTMIYKQILLETLELDFIVLEHFIESEQGSINGALTLVTENYHETSALYGLEYLNDSEKSQSIHLILERFLPVDADLTHSIEAITFHAYR